MQSKLEMEIRDHLVRYLHGESGLSSFEEWFVAASWAVAPGGPAQTW